MRDKIWLIVIILMVLVLACSFIFVYEDLATWMADWAIALGIIYLIVKNRNK